MYNKHSPRRAHEKSTDILYSKLSNDVRSSSEIMNKLTYRIIQGTTSRYINDIAMSNSLSRSSAIVDGKIMTIRTSDSFKCQHLVQEDTAKISL